MKDTYFEISKKWDFEIYSLEISIHELLMHSIPFAFDKYRNEQFHLDVIHIKNRSQFD